MIKEVCKLRFTVEERILLHLLDFTHYRSKIEVPKSITQEGICNNILIQRKHLPRSLKKMEEKNLIEIKTTHVKGKKQRIKTYYLTNRGELKAFDLRESIINFKIIVCDKKGFLIETTIKDVGKIAGGFNSLAKIVSCINSEGIVDLKKIEKNEKKEISDRLKIYKKALEQAWDDGKITKSEHDLLLNLRNSLNISEKEHLKIEKQILKNPNHKSSSEALKIYKIALEQALADNKISADEKAILDKIKEEFSIKDS